MPICKNCGYELVLLSRGRYKCALCSKLYLPKKVEFRTFRIWNQKQRELDLHNLNLEEIKRISQLTELKNAIKQLFKATPEYKKKSAKDYYQKNKEKIRSKFKEDYYKNREKMLEQDDIWREANRETYSLMCKRWLANNRKKRQEFLKAYRINNRDLERQKGRMAHWRKKQKLLADAYLENSNYRSSNIQFFPFSLTF